MMTLLASYFIDTNSQYGEDIHGIIVISAGLLVGVGFFSFFTYIEKRKRQKH
jgi:hypothetical protein